LPSLRQQNGYYRNRDNEVHREKAERRMNVDRLTPSHGWNNACYDTWELCGLDNVCKRDCWKPTPCKIPSMLRRLAAYEDTGLSPADIADLHNELCQRCGQYKTAHLGSCDGCRWKKGE
jgi:hypothetical protein